MIASGACDCDLDMFSWPVHGSSGRPGRKNSIKATLPATDNLPSTLERDFFKGANFETWSCSATFLQEIVEEVERKEKED